MQNMRDKNMSIWSSVFIMHILFNINIIIIMNIYFICIHTHLNNSENHIYLHSRRSQETVYFVWFEFIKFMFTALPNDRSEWLLNSWAL